jgi:DNA modification methylase
MTMKRNRRSAKGGAGGPLAIEHVPVSTLVPSAYNPRTMSRAELRKLVRSMAQFGCVEPLVVRRQDQAVIGGHQRLEAAKQLGLATVPVVYVDVTEAEAKALNLALNKIQGEWDLPKLGALLEELRDLPDLDETLSGFEARELEAVLADLERQQLPPPYEESYDLAAELLQAQRRKAPTRVQPGQLWQLGRHRLLCGDSLAAGALDQLLAGAKADLVLTDPPYGLGYQSALAKRGRRKQAIANDAKDAYQAFLAQALPAVKSVMRRGAVLYWFAGGGGGEPVLAQALGAVVAHFTLLNTLVWDKMDPGLGWRWRRSWEAIIEASVGRPRLWYGGKALRNVLRFPRAVPQADDHPTPKPVPLLEEILRAAAPAKARVLDPFAGSGATLIAAERTGRTALAVELEPRYCDLVLARWEALTGETACRQEAARFGESHPRRQHSRRRGMRGREKE